MSFPCRLAPEPAINKRGDDGFTVSFHDNSDEMPVLIQVRPISNPSIRLHLGSDRIIHHPYRLVKGDMTVIPTLIVVMFRESHSAPVLVPYRLIISSEK